MRQCIASVLKLYPHLERFAGGCELCAITDCVYRQRLKMVYYSVAAIKTLKLFELPFFLTAVLAIFTIFRQ